MSTAVLRGLLREVRVQFTLRNGSQLWRTALMDSYRANRQEKDQARVQQLRRDAEDLYVFLTSNRRHDELIKYYNEPIHDKDDMVERTARLVGLAMPKMPSESSFDEPLEGVVASVTGDASSAIPFSVPDLPTPAGM